MSLVDVLPFDPAMPITFPPQARRTWRAMAPSAVSGSSASRTQTPASGRERPVRQSTATAPAAATVLEEVVPVDPLALERAEQRSRACGSASR